MANSKQARKRAIQAVARNKHLSAQRSRYHSYQERSQGYSRRRQSCCSDSLRHSSVCDRLYG